MIDWQPLKELIESHQRFIITSHVRPDADAIGSERGLQAILESLGKEVRIVNPSATSPHLQFLDPDNTILKIRTDISIDDACDTEVHIVVDTSARGQLLDVCKVLDKTQAKKVVIDHHVGGDDLQALELRDTTAAAAGVLVTELAEYLGVTLDPTAASVLFAAIATDTGWFRFSNTDSRTLQTAARLIDLGVRPDLLYRELYEHSTLARLKLHGIILSRVTVAAGGRLGYTQVYLKDFAETGAHPADTEDIVNHCLTISGVRVAFILVEQQNKQVKCSFRSRSDEVDVAAIANQFGGGGHVKAAGAMLNCDMTEALSRVQSAIETVLGPAPTPVEVTPPHPE
ncbi:MAG: bifunctional oligoribonuclease/PAP phosphatase NrnA [Planctomycetaceae bacterium]